MSLRLNQHQKDHSRFVGTFAVASPYAAGTPFARTVVLMLQHNERGSVGIIFDDEFCRALRAAKEQIHEFALRNGGQLFIPADVRLGLMAWGPGELEDETQAGLWYHTPASLQAVFQEGELWVNLVRSVGRAVLQDALHISTDVNAVLN